MSYEQKTHVSPTLPPGDYTVVARLNESNPAKQPFSSNHALFLSDCIGLSLNEIDYEDGAVYVALATKSRTKSEVWELAARPLHISMARLALCDAEVQAFVIESSQLNPGRRLSVSYEYLSENITLELCDELQALQLQPLDDSDLFLEIEHLSDF